MYITFAKKKKNVLELKRVCVAVATIMSWEVFLMNLAQMSTEESVVREVLLMNLAQMVTEESVAMSDGNLDSRKI